MNFKWENSPFTGECEFQVGKLLLATLTEIHTPSVLHVSFKSTTYCVEISFGRVQLAIRLKIDTPRVKGLW